MISLCLGQPGHSGRRRGGWWKTRGVTGGRREKPSTVKKGETSDLLQAGSVDSCLTEEPADSAC